MFARPQRQEQCGVAWSYLRASSFRNACSGREGGREGKVAVIEREGERPKRLPGCPMPILTPSLSANPLTSSTSAVSGKASSSVLTGQNCCVEHLKRDALSLSTSSPALDGTSLRARSAFRMSAMRDYELQTAKWRREGGFAPSPRIYPGCIGLRF